MLHCVDEEGVPLREIAEVIGRDLGVPVVSISPDDATGHFGFLAALLAAERPASSARTRDRFGWKPQQPGLVEDLGQGHYFETAAVAS